jgi:tetratricopeptide (TPR) repeat protein
MSPEQIRGDQIDDRSDLFSAGATFYELLTYRKPFDSVSLQSTFFKILQEDPEALETVNPSIPPDFSAVVLRAMAKAPAERYQSAEEMLVALQRLEKTQEQRHSKAEEEAREAVESLNKFITQNAGLLKGEFLETNLDELKASARMATAAGAARPYVKKGFLEILEIRDTAKREQQRLEVLLKKHEEAASLLSEARALEQDGQIEKALELIEKVVKDLPKDAEAAASSRRIRKILFDRAKAEANDAVARLDQLINVNASLLEGEDYSSPGDLKAAILLASIGGRAADIDATIAIGLPQNHTELLQIRDRAADECERLQIVIAMREKMALSLENAAKHEQAGKFEEALRLAHEVLNELPNHAGASAVVDRIRKSLAARAREEEKKRRLVRLLRESRQLFAQEKLAESLSKVDEAIAFDPLNSEVLALRREVSTKIEEQQRKQERESKASELFRMASKQYSAGDLAGARIHLIEALDQNPNHSEAGTLLASIDKQIQEQTERAERQQKVEDAVVSARKYLDAENLAEARREIERGLKVDPNWAAAKELLGKIVVAEKQVEERRRKIQGLFQEAASLFQSGDDETAEARVNALLELDAQHADGLELKKKIVERRESRERAIQEKRERIGRALDQARSAEKAGQLDKARDLTKLALKEEAAHPEAQGLLKHIETLLAEKARLELDRRVEGLLARSEELAKQKDYQGAVSVLEKADPDAAAQDEVKQSLKRHREAVKAEQLASEQAEREKRQRILKMLDNARKSERSGDIHKALALARAVLVEDPLEAEAKEIQQRAEEAIEKRRQQEAADNESRELLSQAEKLAARGNYREAMSVLEAAKPLTASLPSMKAALEQYRQAVQAQEEARERTRRIQEHLKRGQDLFERRDYTACERELDQILALEPSHTEAQDLRTRSREQLQKQRDEERRLKELANSLNAARQALKSNDLEGARGHVQRAEALDPNNQDAARLQAQIGQRAAELAAERERQQRTQELLAEVQNALEKGDPERAGALLTEATTLGLELPGAVGLRSKIEKQRKALSKKQPVGTAQQVPSVSAPVVAQRARVPQAAIWIGVLVAALGIGLMVWLFSPRSPGYEQQIADARSYIQQKEFEKARGALQQIPSDSPLYKEAQDLINEASNGEKQATIDAFLADASNLRKQGQNEKSLAAAEKVLGLDSTNQAAKSLRDEIERERFQSKTDAEREQFVNAALASAEALLKSGDLQGANGKADAVIAVRPDDARAANLKQRITTQIKAADNANTERAKSERAKASAENAKAPDLAAARFAAAQRAEQTALRQQSAKQFDQSAKGFSEAAALYAEAEKDARTESQVRTDREKEAQLTQQRNAAAVQALRNQAEGARMAYEQNRTKARDAEAETRAGDRFQAAARVANDAQSKFDRGDFAGARTDWDTASVQMNQAQEAAAKAAQASQQTAQQTAQQAQSAQLEKNRLEAAQRQAAEAAQREETERVAIRAVVARYRTAYEARNMGGIRAVFPGIGGMEETGHTSNFGIARSIQMQLKERELRLTGDTARAAYEQSVEIRTTDNKTLKVPQPSIVFNLGKRGGSWVILSIEH